MIQAIKLQTEHLTTPMGVDFQKPALSWQCIGAVKQTAFQVAAYIGNDLIFDSGKVVSDSTLCVLDAPVPSRCRIRWTVQLWDESNNPSAVAESWFERGLDKADWKAKWIDPEPIHSAKKRQRASYLLKSFEADTLGTARLYITAHGIYDAYINGHHVDGYLLAPGSSQYNKRLQVQTYDVSHLLRQGKNRLLVSLGDGWYRGSTHNDMVTNTFGTDIALLCQLEVDGKIIAVSDASWLASQNGPLGLNDMMMGEEYDATADYKPWHKVITRRFGYDNLIGTNCPPVTQNETFTAKMITTPSGETVLDFGQNIAGFVRLDLTAKAGQKMVLTHGEVLDENGNFTTANFQNPRKPNCHQRIMYICKEGRNVYQPTKCYFGFRYVKVESDFPVDASGFTAVAIYSDMMQTGWFRCGVPEVNRLFENALWSMKSNFVDVPTDCPHREKSGYSGDLVTFCHTAMYLMNCAGVIRRWVSEQAATQGADGGLLQVAPNGRKRGMFDCGSGWCDSIELVPWRLMRRYKDTSFAAENYEVAKRWLYFCLKRAKSTRRENRDVPKNLQPYFVDKGFHWGEWLEPGCNTAENIKQIFQHGEPEVATAYLYFGCSAMAQMAKALGKEEDVLFFEDAAQKAKQAYRHRFIPNGRIPDSKRQCLYVRPLSMGLLDSQEKQAAADALAENIHANGNHLNTGFLSTHELCRVLTDHGHAETAYDLLLQTAYPSWLYPVIKGATTIWENWQGIAEDGTVRDSLNHYSFGSIVGWLFDRAAGIVVEDGNITIHPYPDPQLGYVDAVYDSPMGEIRSKWQYDGDHISFEITVPCNAQAHVVLPDGRELELPAGTYRF